MNCTEFLLIIESKIDDLSSSDQTFDLHLSTCGACASSWSEQLSLKERMEKFRLAINSPLEIRERVLQLVREKGTPSETGDYGDFSSGESNAATSVTQELLREDIVSLMAALSPRERDVLRLRFGLDDGTTRTLEEVANLFGVTRERIRQIEAKALRSLRHPNRTRRPRREEPTE